MNKIVFFELEKWEEIYVKNAFDGYEVITTQEKLTPENASAYQDVQMISIFIYSEITKELLDKLPNLKFITTRSMGYDHIDTEYCKQKGISVSFVPTYGTHTVAEHTFALILAISRKIIPSVERSRNGNFDNADLKGFDLYGKTMGIIGTGNIGKNVAYIALSFGMKVVAFNRHEDPNLIGKGVQFTSLDNLLGLSDVVSLHLPVTKETKHIINMQSISKFKKGAILINTARGALVETAAIADALEKGILAGVGLDVLEEEADLREERELLSANYLAKVDLKTQLLNHVLLTQQDVVITPHNAFNSKEALEQILETTIVNIKGFIGNAPVNIIE